MLKSNSNSLDEFTLVCQQIVDTDGAYKNMAIDALNITKNVKNNFFCQILEEIMRTTRASKSALLVVDVQNDFIIGSLSLKNIPGADDPLLPIPQINALTQMNFQEIYFSLDNHPKNHISFIDNVHNWTISSSSKIQDSKTVKVFDEVIFKDTQGCDVTQKLWPSHCIKGTTGANFYKDLDIPKHAKYVYKGVESDVESYSAFGLKSSRSETGLSAQLIIAGVKLVVICGIATDICVAQTAHDALLLGFQVVLVEDACAGVNQTQIKKVKQELLEAGACMCKTSEISDIVEGRTIPFVHVYMKLKKKLPLDNSHS